MCYEEFKIITNIMIKRTGGTHWQQPTFFKISIIIIKFSNDIYNN